MPPSSIMSISSSLSAEEAAVTLSSHLHRQQQPHMIKKKRNLPGNPDPEVEVVALSPKTLLATKRFVCEICNKGFQRDQNLQLHRRGHNLPWKLKRGNRNESRKKAYVCPETSCVHHHPSRALGDLTGIKKHFCRKHGEKKWKCDKCLKIYAVQSDWKAHSNTCGTREYKCDCGTLFSRKDSFITHRAFCDALAEESARLSANLFSSSNQESLLFHHPQLLPTPHIPFSLHNRPTQLNNVDFIHSLSQNQNPVSTLSLNPSPISVQNPIKPELIDGVVATSSHHLSATALLQKAAVMRVKPVGSLGSTMAKMNTRIPQEYFGLDPGTGGDGCHGSWRLTRDFLGLAAGGGKNVDISVNRMELPTCSGRGIEFTPGELAAEGPSWRGLWKS